MTIEEKTQKALEKMLKDPSDNMGPENASFVEYREALEELWRKKRYGEEE